MTRKEFLRISSILGLGLPFATSCSTCDNSGIAPDFDGHVLICERLLENGSFLAV